MTVWYNSKIIVNIFVFDFRSMQLGGYRNSLGPKIARIKLITFVFLFIDYC